MKALLRYLIVAAHVLYLGHMDLVGMRRPGIAYMFVKKLKTGTIELHTFNATSEAIIQNWGEKDILGSNSMSSCLFDY